MFCLCNRKYQGNAPSRLLASSPALQFVYITNNSNHKTLMYRWRKSKLGKSSRFKHMFALLEYEPSNLYTKDSTRPRKWKSNPPNPTLIFYGYKSIEILQNSLKLYYPLPPFRFYAQITRNSVKNTDTSEGSLWFTIYNCS